MHRFHTHTSILLTAAAVVALSGEPASAAPEDKKTEHPQTQPLNPRKTRPVRKAIIDLKKQAMARRPGQVMPGDASPNPAPTPASELQDKPIDLVDTGSSKAELKPIIESPVEAVQPVVTVPPQPEPQPVEQVRAPAPEPVASTPVPTQAPDPIQPPAVEPAPQPTEIPEVRVVPVQPMPAHPAPESAASVRTTEPVEIKSVEIERTETESTPVEPMPVEPDAPAAVEAQPTPPVAAPKADLINIDRGIIHQLSSSKSTGPILVVAGRTAAGVQWRTEGGQWSSIAEGQSATGKIEVRCGLDCDVDLLVAETVMIRVQRLARVVIERSTEPDGRNIVGLTLSRGAIEIQPVESSTSTMFARVKTPDKLFGVAAPMRVEYDAFSGTKRSLVNP